MLVFSLSFSLFIIPPERALWRVPKENMEMSMKRLRRRRKSSVSRCGPFQSASAALWIRVCNSHLSSPRPSDYSHSDYDSPISNLLDFHVSSIFYIKLLSLNNQMWIKIKIVLSNELLFIISTSSRQMRFCSYLSPDVDEYGALSLTWFCRTCLGERNGFKKCGKQQFLVM